MLRRHRYTLGRVRRALGFTLIEAMVAMLLVGVGMLSLAGVQGTLTKNADMARQRSEATRLAEEKIEQLRSFNSVVSGPGFVSWTDFANGNDTPVGTFNTTYARQWNFGGTAADSKRTIQVQVSWQDRSGTAQAVTLNSFIAQVDPALAGALGFPLPGNGNIKRPMNRNMNIPIKALDLGGGNSVYQLASNFAVVFSNATGYVVMKCNGTVTSSSQLSSMCVSYNAYILAGYISTGGKKPPSTIPVTGLNLASTTPYLSHGSSDCVYGPAKDQNSGSVIAGYNYYLCVMAVSVAQGAWSGPVLLTGMSSGSTQYQVCRYQYPATNGADNNQRNVQPYSQVGESLDQQNYVITTDSSCPTGTVLHQSCPVPSSGSSAPYGCPANPD